MQGIYTPNDSFDFSSLVLSKPSAISGGNYFIRFSYKENPLYIQPPKSKTKQGILKAGKRNYCDLLFSKEHDGFVQWMENLEQYCQKEIFEHRDDWFDGEMELHDVENYFTSPLKSYKSGKCYLVRVNITPVLGKPALKLYDEQENEVEMDSINENTFVMTILELQGIKCSAKSFQIEIEMKQLLVLKDHENMFEKCILIKETTKDIKPSMQSSVKEGIKSLEQKDSSSSPPPSSTTPLPSQSGAVPPPPLQLASGIEEFDFHLDELPTTETVQLRERKEVYFEIYRQAIQKAKLAREMAITAFLEAKQIKNTYMIQQLDSDESDLDEDTFFRAKTPEEDEDDEEDDEEDDDHRYE